MIFSILSQITFLNPIMLSAFIGLPLLWYLLRITPPQPRKIFFPATHFLIGLQAKENVPSKTPWWILLLRILIIALVILALSEPVLNAAKSIREQGAIRIIMDNSWSSAQTWSKQTAAAEEIITQAGREGRDIYIITTTPRVSSDTIENYGALTSSKALSVLRGISPQAYPADYTAMIKDIEKTPQTKTIHTIWLSHGLDEGGLPRAVQTLQKNGSLQIIVPQAKDLPLLLRPPKKASHTQLVNKEKSDANNTMRIAVDAPIGIIDNLPVNLQVNAQDNIILDIQKVNLSPYKLPLTVNFDINGKTKNTASHFKINGRNGAGALYLLDERTRQRSVGIVSSSEKSETSPLVGASFYIKRALEPFADITIGTIDELLTKKVAMMVLPDIAAMPSETLDKLDTWVKNGGLLLRFSGENTAKAKDQYLYPVKLRTGGRSLSGSLTWEKPQTISPFPKNSPLFGLTIPDDLTIKQQVLAEPAQDMEGKIWAQLNDGTPFITAASHDEGLLVLVHTTATPEWSEFSISGLFVNFLKRLLHMAHGNNIIIPQNNAVLDPILILDGEGRLIPPPSGLKGISAETAETIIPNSLHPPGIYGHGGFQYALNIGTSLKPLHPISNLSSSVSITSYEGKYEIDLMPSLLMAALLLLIFDWIVMIILNSNLLGITIKRFRNAVIIIFCLCLPCSSNALASDETDLMYAQGLYLAYVKTGDPALDQVFQSGLEQLAKTLNRRTSIEPAGVVGIDPQNDSLVFFPIIYWGIAKNHETFSAKALQNIQSYLDHGGTILFDTRDNNTATDDTNDTPNGLILRKITSSLNIPPIAPIPDDHVLGRSFYLLNRYSGRYDSGVIWLEEQSVSGRDGVSSVIIGSNDWASGWAESADNYGSYRSGNEQEMSLRFGINLVMYALTGNYKADQVHIPYILERLGD